MNFNQSNYTNHKKHILHPICYYVAMFPYNVPYKLLMEYLNLENKLPSDILVLDPFSGRGTTLLEAKQLGINSIGIDLNPLAYVLSKTKINLPNEKDIEKRINVLKKEFDKWVKNFEINKEMSLIELNKMRIFYSLQNLKQLFFLRKKIGENFKDLNILDNFILAISLGLMHGPSRKNGTSAYFSLSMPNTQSFSPNYVKKYKKKNNLPEIKTNIFDQIKEKVNKIYSKIDLKSLDNNSKTEVYFDSVLNSKKILKKRKVDVILTSPPYLNIINYQEQNWVRLWLLGDKKSYSNLNDKHTYESYKKFIHLFFNEMSKILKNKGTIILIVGDVNTKYYKLDFEKIFNELKIKEFYISEKIREDIFLKKSTDLLGKKAGRATNKDNIYFFKKYN